MIGETIKKLGINKNKTGLWIETDAKIYAMCVLADCCSESWIEHMEGVENVVGAKITQVEGVEMDDGWSIWPDSYKNVYKKGDDELLQYYCTKIMTDKGELKIEYRNLSNGYYGASVEFITAPNTPPYGFKGEMAFAELSRSF